MKKYFLLLIVLCPFVLIGLTRTVALDGTHQYTNIQSAVNASNSGDIILVYPGRYMENINLNHHNVTIASLYSTNPLQTYIDSTIIDGNLNTCIKAENGETFTVNGFTFVNNEQQIIPQYLEFGGAFYLHQYSNASIKNCIIRDCIALLGGGIYTHTYSIVELSNVDIHSNKSMDYGGGISIGNNAQLIWNTQYPSKVYNNVAPQGMDIFISDSDSDEAVNIQLGMGSFSLNQADNFYISYSKYCIPPNVSINQGFFSPIDNDLYVSPGGLDTNDGLTVNTPFKTIKHALQVITSNSVNPKTIHMSEGLYSASANEQVFPLALKPHIRLVGAGIDLTVLDGELQTAFFGASRANDTTVSDMKIINARHSSFLSPICFTNSEDINLRNLEFANNSSGLSSGIVLVSCQNVIVENILAGNTSIDDDIPTITVYFCDNVNINNIISCNNTITDSDYNFIGFWFEGSDVYLRNSIISGNSAQDAFVLYYQNVENENSDYNLDMSNVLIANNNVFDFGWVFAPVYIQNKFQPVEINNCTIAGNISNGTFTRIHAFADISNLISFNPSSYSELYLLNNLTESGIQAEVSIRNSLFRTASIGSSLPNLVTSIDNIFVGNPLFLGSVTDTLETSEPEFYHLSAGSPCINSGTPDTMGLNLPPMDLAGNIRVWDGRIDMGCYEYGSEQYVANDNPEYPVLPDKIMLSTYPNPVYLNGSKGAYTFIEFTLPEKARDKPVVEIYNLKGQRVRTIKDNYELRIKNHELGKQHGFLPAQERQIKSGTSYSTVWDCRDDRSQRLSSGIYIIKVTSGSQQTSTKLTILK